MGHIVNFTIKLDEEAIQQDGTLDQWRAILRLDHIGVEKTWSTVYGEIGAILIGAPIYSLFSGTAYEDTQRFGRYARSIDRTVTETDKPATIEGKLATAAKPKVVTPPPPPRPGKTPTKA